VTLEPGEVFSLTDEEATRFEHFIKMHSLIIKQCRLIIARETARRLQETKLRLFREMAGTISKLDQAAAACSQAALEKNKKRQMALYEEAYRLVNQARHFLREVVGVKDI